MRQTKETDLHILKGHTSDPRMMLLKLIPAFIDLIPKHLIQAAKSLKFFWPLKPCLAVHL